MKIEGKNFCRPKSHPASSPSCGRVVIAPNTLSTATPAADTFGVDQVRQLVSAESLELLYFFKSLSINKTLIRGKQIIELAPMVLSRNEAQLSLAISDQDLGFGLSDSQMGRANIIATLSTTQADRDKVLTVPFVVSNDDFSVQSYLKVFSEKDGDFFEVNSYVEQIQAADMSRD